MWFASDSHRFTPPVLWVNDSARLHRGHDTSRRLVTTSIRTEYGVQYVCFPVESQIVGFDKSTEHFVTPWHFHTHPNTTAPRTSKGTINDWLPVPSFARGQCRPGEPTDVLCCPSGSLVSMRSNVASMSHGPSFPSQETLAGGNRRNKQRLNWPRLASCRRPVVHLVGCEEYAWFIHFLLLPTSYGNRL